MIRYTLEKYQILFYLAAIGFGLIAGVLFPNLSNTLEALLWPILALLLYTTFIQVPIANLRQAVSSSRFVKSAIIGNFLLIPIFVWSLIQFLPDQPAIRLGVLLVLLVPCTDWFITFTHLGGGDTKHAIAFSPISLLLQILLLPIYLWLFLGEIVTFALARQQMIVAFTLIIALPLLAAFITEKWVGLIPGRKKLLDNLAWLPVPILAFVVFMIAATHVNLVTTSYIHLWKLLIIFSAYLIIAGILARILAHITRLPTSQGRVLAFSLGTRNSFVVLPLALALPPSFELAVVAIVFQSLVELVGMTIYLWWIPKKLFPQSNDNKSANDGSIKKSENL